MADHRDRARLVLFLSARMSASVVSVRLRGHGRVSLKRNLPPELLKRKLPPDARSDGLPTDASSASALGCVYERRLTPTWRTQVIDDGAALEAAIGSMERPLVVVEPA